MAGMSKRVGGPLWYDFKNLQLGSDKSIIKPIIFWSPGFVNKWKWYICVLNCISYQDKLQDGVDVA